MDALSAADRDVIFWDRELAGFGVRVYPSGRKVYVVQSRAGGSPRRVNLGTHGEITATQARLRAAQVIDRIKRGEEPAVLPPQSGTTVADLAERYMSAHVAQNCNAHTAGIYRGSLDNHILPALGMMPLAMVESAHVAALHYNLRETPRAANRALSVLSKMLTLAAAWGMVADGANPCRAGLDDVRIHDLRHSYASRALAAGESLSMIGKLLGHADIQSTAHYAHLARETERTSAARVGASIGADIAPARDEPS